MQRNFFIFILHVYSFCCIIIKHSSVELLKSRQRPVLQAGRVSINDKCYI